jgi:hypothetical protein
MLTPEHKETIDNVALEHPLNFPYLSPPEFSLFKMCSEQTMIREHLGSRCRNEEGTDSIEK